MSSTLDPAVVAELQALDETGEFFGELSALFQRNAPALVAKIRACVEAGNGGEAASFAHQLKSSSGGLGARRLQALCEELENLGYAGDIPKLAALCASMEAELAAVSAALESVKRKAA